MYLLVFIRGPLGLGNMDILVSGLVSMLVFPTLGPGHCSPLIIEENNVIFRFAGVKPGALGIHIHMRMLSPVHMHIHNTSMTPV